MATKRNGTVKLLILTALAVVVGLIIWLLPTAQAQGGKTQNMDDAIAKSTLVKVGDKAPEFKVEMLDGSRLTLSSLKGKVVLVNFWATWCPPCREELKRVQTDIIDRFADKEFVFIPISRGEEKETVATFREQMGYTFPMGLDPERKIYDQFASNFIPRNFLIDQEGKVVIASVGYEPEEFDALIAQIETLLNQ